MSYSMQESLLKLTILSIACVLAFSTRLFSVLRSDTGQHSWDICMLQYMADIERSVPLSLKKKDNSPIFFLLAQLLFGAVSWIGIPHRRHGGSETLLIPVITTIQVRICHSRVRSLLQLSDDQVSGREGLLLLPQLVRRPGLVPTGPYHR